MNAYTFALGVAKSLDARYLTDCRAIADRRRRRLDQAIEDQAAIRALTHVAVDYFPADCLVGCLPNLNSLSVKRISDVLFNAVMARGLPVCPDRQTRRITAKSAIHEAFKLYLALLTRNVACIEPAPSDQAQNRPNSGQSRSDRMTQETLRGWGFLMLKPKNLLVAADSLKGLHGSVRRKTLLNAVHRLTGSGTPPNAEEFSAILQMACRPLSVH